ncbi:exo-beta-1,3-glucanase Exg0 [Talaromyces stipitatus ATCC 10500]|uniref:Exo-beta-1,3-glucanase Exg0 n=1 Tax=Talaromyces stipitatus (strain ATCC 10500 / CBS 375.48 / QM 6759 / NRRL 1006) TaxID=441959 RepID=B8M1T2_TALSN|nr:exo-beta-1,3-glucanase Exg0 [Talaromyces stipitatus ATCC 10500]EED21310.1 exo-beta-1,3-glucanase Exg0 [Talaromyces stipitatus ATCC 10500]
MLLVKLLLLLGFSALLQAAPTPQASTAPSSGFWMADIKRQGTVAFGNSTSYQIFRNVKDFGAKGDGSTDDTAAINSAISSSNRCGLGCDSSTTTPAIVYFPPGTYVVSKPIIQYYYTQLIGDATDLPAIKAAASFSGMAVIDSDPYTDTGANWYTNQNNFFRQVRNFVIDLTAMPQSSGAGIHWQVGQATSLQNIRFEMVKGGGDANKQSGIFMDNGSGGFMSDLTFNGGNYGMFLGNQQFTTRNLTFNGCNTAIFMNWNWAWTFKSVTVNDCAVALNMSNSPSNMTVGSVLMLDSTISTTNQAIVTAWTKDSIPIGGGNLILDNVDFTGSKVAVAGIGGNTILAGGSVVKSWVQGNTYTSGSTPSKRDLESANLEDDTCPAPEIVTVTVYQTGSPDATATPIVSPGTSAASRISPASDSVSVSGAAATSVPGNASPGGNPSTGANPSSGGNTSPGGAPSTVKGTQPVATASAPGTATSGSGSSAHTSAIPSGSTCAPSSVSKSRIQATRAAASKPSPLVANGKVFERSKPQYENVPASSFVSVKAAGAKGDGKTDDTAAIQKVLDSATADQIVYFDHGAYIITSTIKVPKNIKIVGEIWPLLMASGKAFSDESKPIPMLQIGQPGETGNVEMQDLILETQGSVPGAILMEWNVAGSSQGSAAMWDVHFRVGGSAGTGLQSDSCSKNPKSTHAANDACIGAFMLFHATKSASAYVENCWFWVADHELDLGDHNQIDIYNGRGVLIESQNAVWMYGTASEHSQLYEYQISNAKNVFMALIQTETPYWQSNPTALTPFKAQTTFNDPDFSTCTTDSCRKAWGLRVTSSSDTLIYGAGLYSFFENYDQTCLATESCQENIVQIDCSPISIYGLSTKASTNMITSSDGTSLAKQEDNTSSFASTIALFEQ